MCLRKLVPYLKDSLRAVISDVGWLADSVRNPVTAPVVAGSGRTGLINEAD